ncbi:hypothetical protein GBA52_011838 [Prunus armeniaca]|nr:hypothetical protein GBA52_011838 [Prunus armeniaca]
MYSTARSTDVHVGPTKYVNPTVRLYPMVQTSRYEWHRGLQPEHYMNLPSSLFPSIDLSYIEDKYSGFSTQALLNAWSSLKGNTDNSARYVSNEEAKIWVPTNPRGAESLPPGIIASESDFYLRRLWVCPVSSQRISAILLFHYDGRTSEWDEFEWSRRAIHVSIQKQTKWWYAKRFLHPDIVAPYDYIFVWDEDLGVEHFNAEKLTEEKPGWCNDPHLPPCAAFVEIMAPVFSRDAWRCVWHMIQNDLVHGWGLDFALRQCVEPAHKKIGVVDAQWIVHQGVPSLGNQGQAERGRAPWEGVRERCRREWTMFQARMTRAEKAYFEAMGVDPPNSTAH